MSDTDDCIAYIALAKGIKRRKNRRKRRVWMKEEYKERNDYTHAHFLTELKISPQSENFENFFSMDIPTYEELLELVSPRIVKKDTTMRDAISPDQRLSTTLRFLATGNSFEELKSTTAISPITISQIVLETCDAMISSLEEYIKFPETHAQWKEVAEGFNERWNFPNCLGAIDAKHVAIKKPPNTGAHYMNYKKFFSVVLMAVVDSNYEFFMVDVGINGRASGEDVFSHTPFGEALLENDIDIPPDEILPGSEQKLPYVFIGDDAFELTPHFMKPFALEQLTDNERIFNYRLDRARRVTENAFGILASRFGIFQRQIQLSPEKVQKVVLASCYLHNFLRRKCGQKYITPESVDSEELSTGTIVEGSWRHCKGLLSLQKSSLPNSTNSAESVRKRYCDYFNNEGQVPWQTHFTDPKRRE